MTDREKLIEILRVPIYPHELADPTEVVADYLLDNGVTFATDNNVGDKMTPTDKDTNVLTNADRIRAMTDEELACFICDRISNCAEQYCPGAGTCGIRIGKASGLVEWLQQPAED